MAFDPMTDAPSNEEEVMIALQRQDELLTSILQSLFQLYQKQGLSLLEAYEKTLLAHLDASDKS